MKNDNALVSGEFLEQVPRLRVPDADLAVDTGRDEVGEAKELERRDGTLVMHERAHLNLLVQIVDSTSPNPSMLGTYLVKKNSFFSPRCSAT